MRRSSFLLRLLPGLLVSLAALRPVSADIFDVVYGTAFVTPYNLYSIDQSTGVPTTLYANYPPNNAGSAAMAERASDGMVFYIAGTAGNDRVYRWNPATPGGASHMQGNRPGCAARASGTGSAFKNCWITALMHRKM